VSKYRTYRSNRKHSSPTSINLDSGLRTIIERYAESKHISRSEAINRAIEALLEQEKRDHSTKTQRIESLLSELDLLKRDVA
jgi:metal-responsive CopG/Arc/MetJ family transcriptional regulator